VPVTIFCLRRSNLKFSIAIATLVSAIVALSGCANCFKCHNDKDAVHNKREYVEVHGHRGARAVRPENSLPAFGFALTSGADTLEMDLGVTKDNVLVIYHDQTINPVICKYKDGRPVPNNLALHSLTLKQVKEFDCGSMQNPRFPKQQTIPGTEIPTFDELMSQLAKSMAVNAKTIRFNIETKSEEANPNYQPAPKNFAQLVFAALKKHNIEARSIVQSFDYRTLIELKKIAPHITTSALIEDRPQGDLVQIVQATQSQVASPNFEWLTRADIVAFHKANIQVIPWTLNDEAAWKRALDIGVDGIITDDPAGLVQFLQE
jgi:glycerophosphoryl diester phosphodiesterase